MFSDHAEAKLAELLHPSVYIGGRGGCPIRHDEPLALGLQGGASSVWFSQQV